MPLVSIVIACLNGHKHLPRAVESVLSQTFTDIELVIIDGASSDGTVDYLRSLKDERLVWRSERDDGITQAWNKALALSQGQWLLFLGADDFIWDNNVIARAAPGLKQSNAAFAFGEVCVVAEHDDAVVQSVRFDKAAMLTQLRSPKGLGLPHQGFFHHRRAFASGLFDSSFRLAADYELISRFLADEDFTCLPIGPVAAFRMGGLSTDPWVSLEAYREWTLIHRLRGRHPFHGWWQLTKAYTKKTLKHCLGAGVARRLVNVSRALRGLPPYSS